MQQPSKASSNRGKPRSFSPVRLFSGFGLPEWIALILYTVWIAIVIAHHEPWADEAQSWLLARDNAFRYMEFTRMHYEGTPALWVTILWPLAHLGFGYGVMHWLSGLFGVALTILILGASPFPRWVRLALPFSVAFLYQGPVVARSYSLGTLLVILLAWMYRTQRRSLAWPLVICGLLAATSLYGCGVSFGFAVLFFVQAYRQRGRLPLAFAGGIVVVWALLVWQALPAPDVNFGAGAALASKPAGAKFLSTMTGIPPLHSIRTMVAGAAGRNPDFQHAWQERAFTYMQHPKPKPFGPLIATQALIFVSIMSFAVSSFVILAIAFYVVLVLWLWRERKVLLLLPLAVLAGMGHLLRLTDHHSLMLWATIVATIWIGWPTAERRSRLHLTLQVLLALVLVQQFAWSVACSWRDYRSPFDPGKQLAEVLKRPEYQGKRIAAIAYPTTAAMPYFKGEPFFNKTATYWQWQTEYDPDQNLDAVLAQKPDVLVGGDLIIGNSSTMNTVLPWEPIGQAINSNDYIIARGWRKVDQYCGEQPQHLGYSWKFCDTIWLPTGKPAR